MGKQDRKRGDEVQIPLAVPLSLDDKDAPFFWVEGQRLSHEGVVTCVRGDRTGSEAVLYLPFLKFLQLEIFNMPSSPISK